MISTCPARRAGARACSLCRPRRPTARWSPPRPSSRPSHRGRSKPTASCSCLKVARHRKAHALAPWGVSVKGRKRGMQPHLVHENQPRGIDLRGHHRPPGGPQELVSLRGAWPPFLRVEPILAMARHMVERLTETPLMASTYSQRSLSMANGCSFRSSSRSLLTRSSILGGLPGALPGSRGSPFWALVA